MAEFELGGPADTNLPFLVERARAIEKYADVETSLSFLFSDLLGTAFELGGIVFFRLTNTSSRNAIFEQLLSKRHGPTFEAYWNGFPKTPNKRGLFTLLRQLDSRRNEIVHWHTVNNVHLEGDTSTSTVTLMRPNAWAYATEKQSITVDDMRQFSVKASFVSRSVNMFMVFAGGRYPDAPERQTWHKTWHGIFQQPCIYPPPADHPLFLKQPIP